MRVRECGRDLLLTLLILAVSFGVIILMQNFFVTEAIAPMIFVVAVLVISLLTHGYVWGIAASLISVLAVNFAFTFPYFVFNFSLPENKNLLAENVSKKAGRLLFHKCIIRRGNCQMGIC